MIVSKLVSAIGFLNGFRKFTALILVLLTAIVFRISDHITGAEFTDLIKNVSIAFMGVNGLEHLTNTVQQWLKDKYGKSNDSMEG